MEDGNQNEDDEGFEEAQKILEGSGLSGKLVSKLIKGFKAKGRQGGEFVNALVLMGQATKVSELAEKAYWDYGKNAPKTDADFKRAEELAERSIKMLDKCMVDFPTTMSAIMPVKKKVMIQYLDIQHQRKGEILSPEELEKEYEENLKNAAKPEDEVVE